MRVVTCELCKRSIDSVKLEKDDRVYRYVSGWTKRRTTGGGTNSIRLAHYHQDRWAHKECVELESSGIKVTQGRLM